MSSQNMKSGMSVREFRKITISHDNKLFTLLLVCRPIDLLNVYLNRL